jgi:hypothetical protein
MNGRNLKENHPKEQTYTEIEETRWRVEAARRERKEAER